MTGLEAVGRPSGIVGFERRRLKRGRLAGQAFALGALLPWLAGSLAGLGQEAGARAAGPGAGASAAQAASVGKAAAPVALTGASEDVQVSAYRSPVAALDSPVSTRVLTPAKLAEAAPVSLDGKLRTVPGFTLFRRSSSLVANPTTEGVSLRGLGSTAASRTLVLLGDVPLNDPYGGWVHWEELPALAIGRVEVVRGGVSDLYGSSAVGGVLEFTPVTAAPDPVAGTADPSTALRSAQDDSPDGAVARAAAGTGTAGSGIAASQWSPSGARAGDGAGPELTLLSGYGAEAENENGARLRGGVGRWSGLAAAGLIGTDGYTLVAPSLRGPADVNSNVHAENALVLGERRLGEAGSGDSVFLRGNVLNESRHNGTPLTTNATRLWRYTAGLDKTVGRNGWEGRAYGSAEKFRQGFSSVAVGRGSETLTRTAFDPADELGGSLRWRRALAPGLLALAGGDVRDVRAEDIEVSALGAATTSTTARQTDGGGYGELLWTPGPWLLSGSARVDHFSNRDAATYTLGTDVVKALPEIEQTVVDPRAGVSRRIGPHLAVSASASRSYRAPTENELYRNGQVGQQNTLANPNLRAERGTGWETGLAGELPSRSGSSRGASWRASYFWTEVNRPVTALTLKTTPTATTLMRENLGQIRSRGVSLDGSLHPEGWLEVTGGYQFARATVTQFAPEPALVGLWIPQVPRNTATLQAVASRPGLGLLSVQAQTSGRQYDDDANTYVLHPFTRFDVYGSHAFGAVDRQRWEVFASVENLLDRSVDVGRTPIRTLGTPQLARFGVRLTLR